MAKKRGDVTRCFGRDAAFPVVLVSTRDNILTAAMAHYFSFEPQTLGVGIHRKRLTFELIRNEKAFVVNIPTAEMVEIVEACGNVSGRDANKFEKFGLTRVQAEEVESSLIAECPVNIECRLVREVEFEERVWFIGEVAAVHEAEGYDSTQSLIYSNSKYYAIGRQVGERRPPK